MQEKARQQFCDIAKQELLAYFRNVHSCVKADGSVLTECDLRMQHRLSEWVGRFDPDAAVLGEEMTEAQQQRLLKTSQRLWCVDPLDGTSNFVAGIPFFSVSAALLVAGKPLLGLVYDPIRNELFYGKAGEGAWLNGSPLQTPQNNKPLNECVANVDFKRLPKNLARALVSQPPYRSQRSFGSVALDWCWIAAGRCEVYLHGKQKLWDYAAGLIILKEAGGFACTLQQEEVFNRTLQPRSVLAAQNAAVFKQWRACCAAGGGAGHA